MKKKKEAIRNGDIFKLLHTYTHTIGCQSKKKKELGRIMVVIICRQLTLSSFYTKRARRAKGDGVAVRTSTVYSPGLVVLVTSTLLILVWNFYWDVLKATVAIKRG